MKSTFVLPALFLALGLTLGGYFIGNTYLKGKQWDRLVSVKGLSEREVPADLAVWPINIVLTGNDLQTLQGRISRQNEQVYTFFMDQGFDTTEVRMGVVNISDAQANIYNNNAQYAVNRYLAKSEITVRTTDIPKLQQALNASLQLLSEGILFASKNEWQPVEYIFTGLNSLKPEMIEEATRNAREVAAKFARDSGSQVGPIRAARQGIFTIENLDANSPHIKKIRVVSTIDYQLVD
ncbi:SIMPL domain-containing protein [Robiginitalea sp. M366]|uniref:SIMPL domain-containing protein n=1 Tax=Robiginitalea aestuariiviva TaxID=3036903 RepID=UPI00240D1F8D|nr:SIMPL domain-containing protein [Robiginitalea aestuariiviva]MDG1570904.1 SIMPL domain-containing protein [Robiginitalea aestuariiviva]